MKRITSLFTRKEREEKSGHDANNLNENIYTHYVALGDSMSTDDYPGEGKGAASLLYKNQDAVHPQFKAYDLKTVCPRIKFQSLALDGATSAHVLHYQLQKVMAQSNEKTLFTLTAGGNDILSGEDAETIVNRLNIIVKILSRDFPKSDLIIGTIYDPTDGVKDLFGPFRDMSREYEILKIVNETIQQFGERPNVRVADVYSHFLGHGSHCKDPENPYYQKDDPSLWFMLTIEPNVRGAHEIRRLFWNSLNPEIPLLP